MNGSPHNMQSGDLVAGEPLLVRGLTLVPVVAVRTDVKVYGGVEFAVGRLVLEPVAVVTVSNNDINILPVQNTVKGRGIH